MEAFISNNHNTYEIEEEFKIWTKFCSSWNDNWDVKNPRNQSHLHFITANALIYYSYSKYDPSQRS